MGTTMETTDETSLDSADLSRWMSLRRAGYIIEIALSSARPSGRRPQFQLRTDLSGLKPDLVRSKRLAEQNHIITSDLPVDQSKLLFLHGR